MSTPQSALDQDPPAANLIDQDQTARAAAISRVAALWGMGVGFLTILGWAIGIEALRAPMGGVYIK